MAIAQLLQLQRVTLPRRGQRHGEGYELEADVVSRGWLILGVTLLVGIILGFGIATRGPTLIAPYLPKAVGGGSSVRVEGQVVRKQRDGNRLLVKVETAQGPMLVVFTEKAPDLDVLLDPGDRITLLTPGGYTTFVDNPALEHVAGASRSQPAPVPSASTESPKTPGKQQ
jgi:hypothetical protein